LTAVVPWLWQAFAGRPASGNRLAVILWWELRRPVYNVAVGISGTLSLLAVLVIAPDYFPEPLSAVAFGFLCNVCYTGGWITELLVRWWWPRLAQRFGPTALVSGFRFSVLVPWLLPLYWLVYQAGCDHRLSDANLPGTYTAEYQLGSYTLRIDNDGGYEETYALRHGNAYSCVGTWRSSMGGREPEVVLEQLLGHPFNLFWDPTRRLNWRLALRKCWGETVLHIPHDPDDTVRLVKTE
jgi:hypothetical protein